MPKSKVKTNKSNESKPSAKKCAMESFQEIQNLWENRQSSDQIWQCRTQLLTFLLRTQKENETAVVYLTNLQEFALDAGIASKKQIVCQFMTGCRDTSLQNKLSSLKELPSLTELRKICSECEGASECRSIREENGLVSRESAFNMLFERNVVHILEKRKRWFSPCSSMNQRRIISRLCRCVSWVPLPVSPRLFTCKISMHKGPDLIGNCNFTGWPICFGKHQILSSVNGLGHRKNMQLNVTSNLESTYFLPEADGPPCN